MEPPPSVITEKSISDWMSGLAQLQGVDMTVAGDSIPIMYYNLCTIVFPHQLLSLVIQKLTEVNGTVKLVQF